MENLKKNKLDGLCIPKNDEFFGEYVSEGKDILKYITNFSGSYGFALILKKKNYLFVDGRYVLQANIQSGKTFKIITIPNKFPSSVLSKKKIKIGFDSKVFTENTLSRLFKNSKCKLVPVNYKISLKSIKQTKNKKIFLLDKKDVGQHYKNKIILLSKELKKNKVDLQFVSSPENVGWLLNVRGEDTKYSPLSNSYAIINDNGDAYFFFFFYKITKKIRKNLNPVKIMDIKKVKNFLSQVKSKKIQIDKLSCSVFFENLIKKNNLIVEKIDPIYQLKSIKNKTEIRNTILSHVYDGVSLTKFLFWVQNNFKIKKITEISAQDKLLRFRRKNKYFRSLSFPTISGSGPNGAIIHYKASKKSNRVLKKGELYLIDSGGQYNFGTTDVTRTLSLGNQNRKIKDIYTRVLKGHIAVASFKIRKKTTGSEIDLVARKPLKQINLDYAHGTGHGVGYFSNVHEGPQGISRGNNILLKEGMIVSNEPGYYENNNFGIRIENLITVKKTKLGFKFQNLTVVPIEKSLIEKKLLNKKEIDWINTYHNLVFNKLKLYMNNSELRQLKKACSNI